MSLHVESSSQSSHEKNASPAHAGNHDGETWQSGAHNLQRTMENIYAPIEFAHHLHHPGALGSLAAESAVSAPALPEFGQMVDALHGTGPAGAHPSPAGSPRGLGSILGGLSGVFGAVELAHGVHELGEGEKLQGTLDSLAGLAGIGSGGLALLGSSLAGVTALPAAGLGMVAYGEKKSREWDLLGHGHDGKPRSNFEVVSDFAKDAYTGVHDSFGRGIAGKVGGVAAAGLVGLATGTIATLANLGMGAIGAGLDAGRFIGRTAEALWHRDGQPAGERVVA
jgi:hypothetical protein